MSRSAILIGGLRRASLRRWHLNKYVEEVRKGAVWTWGRMFRQGEQLGQSPEVGQQAGQRGWKRDVSLNLVLLRMPPNLLEPQLHPLKKVKMTMPG